MITAIAQFKTRGYQSSAEARFHCDPTDIVALLCVRQARAGGESALISSHSIYNELVRECPDVLPSLFRGFAYDRKGEQSAGEPAISDPIPVFQWTNDRLYARYARSYIEGAAQKAGTATECLAALGTFDNIAKRDELALHMMLEPGDIQFANNFSTLHARGAFEDFSEPALRRFLWRQWFFVDEKPWNQAQSILRYEFARFGSLGRTHAERAHFAQGTGIGA